MKIKLIASIALLAANTAAFASTTTYNCNILRNSAGEAIMGGPGYQIEVSPNDVVLKELVESDEGIPLVPRIIGTMIKASQEVEFATYKLDDVSATIGRTFSGFWRETVMIDVTLGNETYTATCK